jgi:two-component system response regulator RegA
MFGYAECLRQKRFGFVNVQISTVERLEWEHIQRVLHEHQDNISATARALNMHRRTLQRKLAKPPLTGIQDEK